MSAEATIRDAIADRNPVRLTYRASSEGERIVHPHALYVSTAGNLSVDAYQVAGYSSSGDLPMWRMLDVSKILEISIMDGSFDVADGFDPAGAKYAKGLLAFVR